MTQMQALEAIEALVKSKEIRKNSDAYRTAIAAVNNPGTPHVCGKEVGSGRFSSSKSWQMQTSLILSKAGIAYECSNVAPQGGKNGDRITVKELSEL